MRGEGGEGHEGQRRSGASQRGKDGRRRKAEAGRRGEMTARANGSGASEAMKSEGRRRVSLSCPGNFLHACWSSVS
eukprot:2348170-Pyramimonas_sp.AAC.1